MTNKLVVNRGAIRTTLGLLHSAGRRRSEGVVLWLGVRNACGDVVRAVYEPIHRAAVDFFHIPPHGVDALMRKMDETSTCVVAQVHTHPGHAFHSSADDEWAIVRHVGAFSLVLPAFASKTNDDNFVGQVALFQLGPDNHWHQVPAPHALEITP